MIVCDKVRQNHICVLEKYHNGPHKDINGFQYWDDNWPNHLGNGPDGYPMNNPVFEAECQKVIEEHKENAIKAKLFLQKFLNILKKEE